jgi:hypothetical protein
MEERRCRYCQQAFQPSKYRPGQAVCSDSACQRQRRSEDHRRRLATDPEYRQVCRDSPRKWRGRHHDYWKRRRQNHPEVAERNRQRQRFRDQKRRLRRLANNNLVFDLKSVPAEVWLVGAGVEHLANNNLAPAQVVVFQGDAAWLSPPAPSCQQQRSSAAAAAAP